jgi:hypothetical protein
MSDAGSNAAGFVHGNRSIVTRVFTMVGAGRFSERRDAGAQGLRLASRETDKPFRLAIIARNDTFT